MADPKMFVSACSLAAALLVLAPGQAGAFERPEEGVYKDRIDWGVTIDMSGPASSSQLPWYNGFTSYIKAANEAGSIHGRKVNVLGEDNRFDVQNERIAYEKFINQTPVIAMSGAGSSSAQVALLPMLKKAKLPVVASYTSAKPSVEPPNPYFYGGFCGFKEMAQVGIGYMTDSLKLKEPKIALIQLDTASGKEFLGHMEGYLKDSGLGGTVKAIPIKVVAADATPQVLELVSMKPDFVFIYGVAQTSILTLKAMQQYGLSTPTVAIAYLGTPGVYENIGKEAGKNYTFVSCFTPSSSDPAASAALSAAATKYGHGQLADDINFVSGWVAGQIVTEALKKVGPEPTREKLVDMLNAGFEVDSKGLSSQIKYTPESHAGLTVLKPFGYDYESKKFKAFGDYKDYAKYLK